ncbi:hypothetical protein V1L52_06460 [Treponema sp. HNW]|uniref:hypothetical protein n=1 Tax=Treponema sp. HNW TaxID=3116654 RepID=UPI003D143920
MLRAQKSDLESGFDGFSWYILAQAQNAFDEKDFGSAFRLVENAKQQRKAEHDWAVGILDSFLSSPIMLKIGSDINIVLDVLRERNNRDAIRIIEAALDRFGIEYFDFSIYKLNEYIKNNTSYPEADFLLGKLYMHEGEYGLSEHFYAAAYEQRLYLDVSDIQFDILYDMAELYALSGNNEKYEAVLLILASRDENYISGGKPSAFLKAVRVAVERGTNADKFFLLYRNNNYTTLYVWLLLTKYYHSLGLTDKAFDTCLLFCLTALSRTDDIVKSRESDYIYTDLTALLGKIKQYSDINSWAAENRVWEGFYLLGRIASTKGYRAFARDIFTALSQQSTERKWKILAEKELTSTMY